MRWLVDTAKRYVLCGESFEDMCDHNAAVAFSLSRHQVRTNKTIDNATNINVVTL